MTLIITGAGGFIGRALLEACRRRGIDARGIDAQAHGDGVAAADITDPSVADLFPEGARAVVHLAALSRDPDCRADPRGAFAINTTGALTVAEAARRRNIGQMVFASTEWVYGDVRNDEVQVEDQPIDAMAVRSVYALSKIAAEQGLRLAFGEALQGLTVLRFGIVYGSRAENWSAVESLFNAVRTRDEVTVGCLGTARRFIHVDDIVEGILASLGRSGYEVFNLAGDRLVSLGDVIETSRGLLGRNPVVRESAPGTPSIRNPESSRFRTATGWRPRVSLEQGLRSLESFLCAHHREG